MTTPYPIPPRYRIVYADDYRESWTGTWAAVCYSWHYQMRLYGGTNWSPVRVEHVPASELYGAPCPC